MQPSGWRSGPRRNGSASWAFPRHWTSRANQCPSGSSPTQCSRRSAAGRCKPSTPGRRRSWACQPMASRTAPARPMPACLSCGGTRPSAPSPTFAAAISSSTVFHSNSGMNLPRRVIAELAGSRPFFGSIVETHSQPINLERVARGEADATCVDCVTYAFFARHRPALAEQLRILAATPPTPAIPFVTAAATDPVMKAALAQALRRVATEPEWAPVRAAMLLLDVVPPDQVDYQTPCRYADEAAALGYPRLH